MPPAIPRRTPGVLGLLAMLAGCTAAPPFPYGNQGTDGACPTIAGTYGNVADPDAACTGLDASACGSLAFYFFSRHVREAAGVSNIPTPSDDWPAGRRVRIEAPAPGLLRIAAQDCDAPPRVRELRRDRGDFECQGGALRLRPRVQRDFLLWAGRRTLSEYLTVSGTPDALVIDSRRHYDSYILWLFGGTMRQEHDTLRWRREP